jgi:hypothetical protein
MGSTRWKFKESRNGFKVVSREIEDRRHNVGVVVRTVYRFNFIDALITLSQRA